MNMEMESQPQLPIQVQSAVDAAGNVGGHAPKRRVVASLLALVLVGGVVAVGLVVLGFVRGSGDVLAQIVPDDAGVYTTVYLDPSGSQKVNMLHLFSKFPGTSDQAAVQKKVDDTLDDALRQSGLSHTDVDPWLGTQVAIVTSSTVGSNGATAFLVAEKDDSKALTSLRTWRNHRNTSGAYGVESTYTWKDETHGGVVVSSGEMSYTSSYGDMGSTTIPGSKVAYAVVAHTVILGQGDGSTDMIDSIIDTAQGKHARLSDNANYKKMLTTLASDKLALVYVNTPALIASARSELQKSGSGSDAAFDNVAGIGVIGGALTAQQDGIAFDGNAAFDLSKLTAAERAIVGGAPHANTTVGFVPQNAWGFLTMTGLKQIMQYATSTIQSLPNSDSIMNTLDQIGLTGSGGVIDHLTGDAGISVGPSDSSSSTPSGALLIGTDSADELTKFFDNVATTLAPGTKAQRLTESYRGVDITTVKVASPQSSFSSVASGLAGTPPSETTTAPTSVPTVLPLKDETTPSPTPLNPIDPVPSSSITVAYAVSDNMGIIGPSAQSVKDAIDAHLDKKDVTGTDHYKTVIAHGQSSNNGMAYADITAIASEIRSTLSSSQKSTYDSKVAPYLNPFKELLWTYQDANDRQDFHLFVEIG